MNNNKCPNAHNFNFTNFNYKGSKYTKNECKDCKLVFTEPVEGLRDDIYDSGHYEVKGFKLAPFIINMPDYLYMNYIIKTHGFDKSSVILDFGCGKGFFLYALKLLGYKCLSGLETSKPRADFSRNLTDLHVSEDFYNGGEIMGKKYDIITLVHVLENIPDPFSFLDILIRDSVSRAGSVFIEVPNICSLSSRIAKKYWAHFTPHFHTNHFSIESLKRYCNDRSLRFSVVGTFSFYNSSMGMTSALLSVLGYKGSIFEDLKRKKILIIIGFLLLLPLSLTLELVTSIFSKRGSVIKFMIYK